MLIGQVGSKIRNIDYLKFADLSKHLVFILQGGQPFLQLRVVLLQVVHPTLQLNQVGLLPLPCLLS